MLHSDIEAWNRLHETQMEAWLRAKEKEFNEVWAEMIVQEERALFGAIQAKEANMAKPSFVELAKPERKRTYVYPDEKSVSFNDVTRVAVSASGTHRLETADGGKYIVPTGWRFISLDMDDWTF